MKHWKMILLVLGLHSPAFAWFADLAAEDVDSDSYLSKNYYLTLGRDNTNAPEITALSFFSFTREFPNDTSFTDYGLSIDTTFYNQNSFKLNASWVAYFSHHFSETWAYRLSAIYAINEKANLALTYEKRNYSDTLKDSDKILLGGEIYTDFFYISPSFSYASTKNGDAGETSSLKIAKEWKDLYASYMFTAGKDLADINIVDKFISHTGEIKYSPWNTGLYYSRFLGEVRQEHLWGLHITWDFK